MDLDKAVVVGLGSNLHGVWRSSAEVLEDTLNSFASAGLQVAKRSSWWRSAAWPDPTEPDYINAIALVETMMSPQAVLLALHTLEARFGRRRSRLNAPRVLDLDLVAYGRLVLGEPGDRSGLILPHPRAAERAFVMRPLAEIAPDWRHPVTDRRAFDLATEATVGRDAASLNDPPLGSRGRAGSDD